MGGLKSSHYVRTVFRENRAIYCVAVLVAVVLSAGCGGGSGSSGQIEPTPTASVNPTAVQATPSPSVEPATSTPTSTPTAAPTLPPAPTQPPAPTADTRVPLRDLPTADQVQLGKDGKYFLADRGDGCTWVEYLRDTSPEIGLQVFLGTDCPADFAITFRPESGVVLPLVP